MTDRGPSPEPDSIDLPRIQRDLAFRLTAARTIGEVVADLLDAAGGLEGVDAVGIYTRTEGDDHLHLSAHRGVSDELAERVRTWRDDMPSGAPVLDGRSISVPWDRLRSDPWFAPLLDEGLRSEVLVPVQAGDDVPLTLALASRRLDEIPVATRQAAEVLAHGSAQAVRRASAESRRRQAEAAAREALELQVRAAATLLGAADHGELFERIVDVVAAVPWVDSAAVYRMDRRAGVARLVASRNLPAQLEGAVEEVPLGAPEAKALAAGRALYEDDDEERHLAPFREEAAAAGVIGRALVPVATDGRVVAIIAAVSRRSRACPGEIRAGLEAIALQVGAALERLDAELELRRSEGALRRAQQMAGLGTWRWDPDTDEVWLSEEMSRILGLDPGAARPGIGFLIGSVHPEDREPDIQLVSDGSARAVSNRFEQRLVRPDGTVATVQSQLEIATDGDRRLVAVLGVVQDLSEQRRIEAALARRLRFERAIAAISAELLRGRQGALDRVLRELLVVSDASRVYLFENYDHPEDGPSTRQIAEACAPGVEPQADNPLLQHCPWRGGGFERWPALLAAGEPVQGLVEHLPAGERAGLEVQGILSLLVLPVFSHDEWWGFVGFDDTSEPRQWQEDDVLLLRTAAEMIGTFLERRRPPRDP